MSTVPMAFLRRDLFIWASYRTSVVSFAVGVGVLLGMVYFLGNAVDADSEHLNQYGGDYVAFLLAGFALTDFFNRGLSSLPGTLRECQQTGTLEPLLVTPLGLAAFIAGSSLFKLLLASIRAVLMLLFGVLVLGFWHSPDPVSMLIVLIPGSVAVFALSLLFSAFVVLIKQADPIIAAYGLMAAVLGGLLFPVQALPIWIKPLAWFIPLSHTLTGLRLALHGSPPSDVLPQALALLALSAVLVPISIISFNWALTRAKQDGTLSQY